MAIKDVEKVIDEFNHSNIELNTQLKLQSITARDYENFEGEPAILVTVIFDEHTKIEDLTGDRILVMKRRIRNWFFEKGVNLFPYTRFLIDNEEPAEDDDE